MKNYPAKLLLFGEHVLLLGASALTVPVTAFGAHWEQASPKADIRGLQMRLSEFADSEALRSIPGLNADQLKKDLLYGLFFRSNIPVGYGLGSSGALCAAVYDRYWQQKTSELAALKAVFAGMEQYFHGSSSGIDPLTSYLNKPLFIRQKTEVSVAAPAGWQTAPPTVFLLDTRLPRQTGPLVQWFLEQSAAPAFAERLDNELLPVHEAMVQAWMQADAAAFWPNLQKVSRFQLRHFEPMVPATIRDFWEKNLDHPEFALKICGGGGGGFMLGFARNREVAENLPGGYRIVFPLDN